MSNINWVDGEEDEDFTEISPLLVQKRDQFISPTVIESLDYDRCPNEPYMNFISTKTKKIISYLNLKDWIMFSFIGIATGLVAFAIDMGVTFLSKLKFNNTYKYLEKYSALLTVPMMIYIGVSLLYCLVASAFVAFTPEAAGSGIPEIKCYLNGIRLPRVVRIKTLVCKAFGVMFSVAGGLPCGKEGPMIHSGAALGAGIPEGLSRLVKRLGYTESFFGVHDDRAKRDFISAGAAAGVSAAFGAPLGGVLFSLEEGSSFWNQALTWKTLFCSMCSAFVLQILKSTFETRKAGIGNKYSGLINFGEFKCVDGSKDCMLWGPKDLIVCILMGAVGGLMGAMFNQLNLYITKYRINHVNKKGRVIRMIEVALIGIVISALAYVSINTAGHCVRWNKNGTEEELQKLMKPWHCPDKHHLYNDYGTLAFNSQENTIKMLFHHFNYSNSNSTNCESENLPLQATYHPLSLIIFLVLLFLTACWTYGIGVPSGLFVPCLLIGATYGRIFAFCYQQIFKTTDPSSFYPGTYALIGAAAFLGGVVRMTISLTVILIETTRNISYGLPIMLTLMVAKWVGDIFNKGLYDIHIELKHWPLLEWEAEPLWETIRAKDFMKSNLEWLNPQPTVGRVVEILKRTKHSAFPVCVYTDSVQGGGTLRRNAAEAGITVNDRSQLRLQGLILRSQIVTLLKKEHYFDSDAPEVPGLTHNQLTEFYPKYPDIDDITLTIADQNKIIDCTKYMNPCPYTVSPLAPITKVFTLFRSLGLRHLIVVNNLGEVEGIITRSELQEHHIERVYKDKVEIDNTIAGSAADLRVQPGLAGTIQRHEGVSPSDFLQIPQPTRTLRTF